MKECSFGTECRKRSFVFGRFVLDKRCVSGTANGGLHRKWLVESLVVQVLVIDRSILDRFTVLVTLES